MFNDILRLLSGQVAPQNVAPTEDIRKIVDDIHYKTYQLCKIGGGKDQYTLHSKLDAVQHVRDTLDDLTQELMMEGYEMKWKELRTTKWFSAGCLGITWHIDVRPLSLATMVHKL